ncbi:MAG: hypothetical protein RJA37_1782, partial [Verrucomicrobiota bacterium]
MTLKPGLLAIAILMTGAWGAYLLFPDGPGHEHGLGSHHHVSEDESELRGPNNGRLFRDGVFELELTIFERGTPPEFRAWCRFAGRPVAPAEVQLAVRLERPGAKSDQHRFLPAGGYLRSPDEVYEPHSFTYHVTATYAGKERRWVRAAPDMQTTIAAAVAEASGVRVQRAAPAPIVELVSALGFIRPADGRSAAVSPRFAGVLREMRKTVGDQVSAGEVLAVVETNLTLASVDLKSPLTGVVVARTAVPGQTVAEGEALLQVADLSEVWAELRVSCGQIGRVAPGSRVTLRSAHGADSVESEVVWIAPVADPLSQSVAVRAVLRLQYHFQFLDITRAFRPLAVADADQAAHDLGGTGQK